MAEYRQHDERPWELEPYRQRHVSAMTTENLHHKSDIANELAVRDKRIAEARSQRDALRAERDRLREAVHLGIRHLEALEAPGAADTLRAALAEPTKGEGGG